MSRDRVSLLGSAEFIGSALAMRRKLEKMLMHVVTRHDTEQLEQALPQCGTVVHLASATAPGSAATYSGLDFCNLALNLRLLELLQRQPETHLILLSSGGTGYGNPDQMPVTEDVPIAPRSNHCPGKAAQEGFCQTFRTQVYTVAIHYPLNAYGRGQTVKSGFALLRTLLEHVRVGASLEIWGDGENVRDFTCIGDIVEATARLIKLLQDSGTYTLGSSAGYSINQVKCIGDAACGKELRTICRPAKEIDVRSVALDNARLNSRLRRQLAVGLVAGVACTWKWLRRA